MTGRDLLAVCTKTDRLVYGLLMVAWMVGNCRAGAISCPDEQRRARASALKINEEWPLRPTGDEVARYLQRLGERLARATSGGATEWRFTTIRDRAPFAFAIGYGHVYVTDGTLRFARSESELAAVLAHEIGHQLAGHFCNGGDPSDGQARRTERTYSPLGSLNQVLDLTKEQEADRHAVAILSDAGFDPRAMYTVAERLPESAAYGHAQGDDRRLQSIEAALKAGPVRRSTTVDSDDFRRAKASVEAIH